MVDKLERIDILLSNTLYEQYDNLKEIFYNYAKPRYLLATSAIIGTSLISENNICNKLHLFSCVCLGGMLYFHDNIDNLAFRYEQGGIDGIIDDYYLFLESKYLVAKEQYEYYKDCILANF